MGTFTQLLVKWRDRCNAQSAPSTLSAMRTYLQRNRLKASEYVVLGDLVTKLAENGPIEGFRHEKIAVLGGVTTAQIVAGLRCALLGENVLSDIYEAPFNVFRQEILEPDSALYRFLPSIVLIVVDHHNISRLPDRPMADDEVEVAVAAEVDEYVRLWKILRQRRECVIIQHTFDHPDLDFVGDAEWNIAWSQQSFTQALNTHLADKAPPFVNWLDINRVASTVGRRNWFDPRLYYYAKMPFNPQFLPDYLDTFLAIWRRERGRTRKALVVDLDNTLWGGVIGDDGLDGIRLGNGSAEGEAYADFCRYIKALNDRGVILAVCSKNDPKIAVEVFEQHHEMPLKLDHFAAFVCNWNDKVANLRQIAKDLNIDISSLVFVDDSPAECELVRRELPEVAVIQLPEDPAQFARMVDSFRYFDISTLSEEDIKRAASYVGRRKAVELGFQATDLDSYLEALKMIGMVYKAEEMDLPRLSQMELKINQFNLTTRRYGQEDIVRFIHDPDRLCFAFGLCDKFTDYGLVSSLLAVKEDGTLRVDSWLMSCRVFSRTAEEYIMNRLVEGSRTMGVGRILGEYLPTPKNRVVKDLYARLGFQPLDDSKDGRWWELILDGSGMVPLKTFVRPDPMCMTKSASIEPIAEP